MEEIGIDSARKDLGGIVNRAQYKNEPTLITRAGKPAAVMVSIDMARALWHLAAEALKSEPYATLWRELADAQGDGDGDDALD